MATSTPTKIMAEDRADNATAEVVLSPQRQTEFQCVSLEVQQNHVSQPTLNPPNMVDEGVSTSVLTSSEIRVIKQRNPTKALLKLQ